MKMRKPIRDASFAMGVLFAASAVHAQSCEPIHFERGHYSGTVRGASPHLIELIR
jgi:hypothetical protein